MLLFSVYVLMYVLQKYFLAVFRKPPIGFQKEFQFMARTCVLGTSEL